MQSHNRRWIEEDIDKITRLYSDGISTGKIALQIGEGVTRNAIIGILHRHILPKNPQLRKVVRPFTTRPKKAAIKIQSPCTAKGGAIGKSISLATQKSKMATIRKPSPPKVVKPVSPEVIEAAKTTIFKLRDGICRWPVGNLGDADFHFCGMACTKIYCDDHMSIAVNPTSKWTTGERNARRFDERHRG